MEREEGVNGVGMRRRGGGRWCSGRWEGAGGGG